MTKTVIAKKTDWKTMPMPDEHTVYALNRSFTEAQMNALRRGNIPKAMEDKWFWYMEGNTLYAHRSWTGICIYIIEFGENGVHKVTANRDPEEYRVTDQGEDLIALNKLLDWWSQDDYDHYSEWISETLDMVNSKKG